MTWGAPNTISYSAAVTTLRLSPRRKRKTWNSPDTISYNATIRAPRLSRGILCKTWSTPNTISYSAAIQCRMCRTSLALSRTAVCRWPGEA